MQNALQLARTGRRFTVVADLFVEDHATHCVVLAGSEKRQARREELRVAQLCDGWPAKAHRRTGIDQDHQVRIRVPQEPLNVGPFGPGKHVPVDKSRIVTLVIHPVFGKLLAEAERWRPMQADHDALYDRARHEIEIL